MKNRPQGGFSCEHRTGVQRAENHEYRDDLEYRSESTIGTNHGFYLVANFLAPIATS